MFTPERPRLGGTSPSPERSISSTKAKRVRNTSSASVGRKTNIRSRSQSLAQSPSTSVTTPEAELRPPDINSELEADFNLPNEAASEPLDKGRSLSTPTPPSSTTRRSSATRRGPSDQVRGLSTPTPPPTAARKSPTPKKNDPLNSSWVDGRLARTLKETPKKGTRRDKEGYNYVIGVVRPDGTRLIKIGIAKDAETRRTSIGGRCGHTKMETLNFDQQPIREYKRAEILIKAELHNFRYQFDCECRTQHTEYFDVHKDVALEVAQRWTAFCRSEPWDENGKLHLFWERRLENRLFCKDGEKPREHAPRAKRWAEFTNPTQWDAFCFNAASVHGAIWPWRWHWVSLLQALLLACLTFPDLKSAAWLVACVIWVLGERHLLGTPILWGTPRGQRGKMDRSLRDLVSDVVIRTVTVLSDVYLLIQERDVTGGNEETDRVQEMVQVRRRENAQELDDVQEIEEAPDVDDDVFIVDAPSARRTQSA